MSDTELKLLNNVELKFALANADASLQKLLSIYLCPVLLKLDSLHADVRQKVRDIISMLSGRLASSPNIVLPLDSLLAQYKNPVHSAPLKRFTLHFLKIAQERCPMDGHLLPLLIDGIHLVDKDQQQVLVQMIFKVFQSLHIPSVPTELNAFVQKYQVSDELDQRILSQMLCNLMLLNLAAFTPNGRSSATSFQGVSIVDAAFIAPDGLQSFSVASLNKTKLGALRYLSTDVIQARLRFPPALFASFDLDAAVQQLALDIIRRKCDVDWEDADLVKDVYRFLALGNSDATLSTNEQTPLLAPLAAPIRIKLLQYLSKSKCAVRHSELALAAMLDGFKAGQPKLIQATVSFVHWFARTADLDGLQRMTRPILMHLTNHLNAVDEGDASRGFAYIAVGLLASRDVQFTQENPDLIANLFASLGRAKTDTRLAIEEALSSCINTFRFAQADALYELRKILLNVVVNLPPHTHATAVRFALNSFSFGDVGARFICLLAARSESKPEIQLESHRGLEPHQFRLFNRMNDLNLLPTKADKERDSHRYDLPKFADLVTWPVQNLIHGEILDLQSLEQLSPDVAENYIIFARHVLMFELLQHHQTLAIDENWATAIDNALESDPEARTMISSALMNQSAEFAASLERFEGLVAHLFLSGSKVASDISLELLVLGSSIEKPLQRELGRIRDLSLHANSDVQAQICRMRAILSLRLTDAEAQVDIKNALQLLQEPSQTFGRRYGSLLYLPYFILRLSLAGRSIIFLEDVNIVYERLLNHLDDRDGRIAEAALDGLAQLALLELPIAFDSTKIQRLVTKTTNLRIREAAIITLGYISLSYTSTDDKLKSTIAFLLTQQDSNAVDTYIATGEALAVAFGGFQASVVPIKLNLHPLADLPAVERDDLFAKTVDQILTLHVRTPKKTCRKAACLWLLTLVQLLKHNPVMTSRLKQLHQAFMTLMADQDEFVIESASQGVQLVYKLSDQKTKDELVSSLMGTFASDRAAKAAAGNIGISSESELFAPGTMSVGDNNSVSTYKDICDLAVDMGNNELVYQFMSLASSASIWSTRRGSALGLSSILASSGGNNILTQNPALLKRLVPRLYRYKHDPSKTVAKTMNDIFTQVCPDEKAALKEQFDDIMRELLNGLSDRAWRTRESSCNALVGLLLGRNMAELDQYTEQLWQTSFRVLDDVKESVRIAALGLCKSLTRLIIKGISTEGKGGPAMLDAALPIFLRNLKSPSLEVSSFSLDTLLKLVKASGRAIQPYLAQLVEEFMLLTTNMEPEMLNYLSFHASKYNVTQSQLDEARLSSMRSNPIMAALEDCVDQLTEQSAPETFSRLCGIIRQTNGLPTKAACARFIISACSRKPHLLKREADALIQALSGNLNDANETTRTAYASSVGYLARLCEPTKLLKLITFLNKSFFAVTEQDASDALPLVLSAISQNALDRFQALATAFVPIVFLGLHEEDERMKGLFDQTWQRCTTSKAASVRLYLPEILELCERHLVSPIWRVKQIAARSLADAAEAAELTHASFERVFESVLSALTGRSWKGKEQVLNALVSLVKSRAETLSQKQLNAANAAMLKEFRRTAPDYKRHALTAMSTYLRAIPRAKLFEEVAETIAPFLLLVPGKDADGDEEMIDLDEIKDKERAPMRLVIVQACIACLFSAVRPDLMSVDQQSTKCVEVAEHIHKQNYPWNVTLQLLHSITEVFQLYRKSGQSIPAQLSKRIWAVISDIAEDQSYMTLRESAVSAAAAVLAVVEQAPDLANLRQEMLADIAKFKANESSPAIKAAWAKLETNVI